MQSKHNANFYTKKELSDAISSLKEAQRKDRQHIVKLMQELSFWKRMSIFLGILSFLLFLAACFSIR